MKFKNCLFHICFIILFVSLLLSKVNPVYGEEIFSSWTSTSALPYTLASHITYPFNQQQIFILGGANSNVINTNLTSTVNSDGTINIWTNSSTQFPTLFYHAYAKRDNYIFILGGATHPPTVSSNQVLLGTTSQDGSVSSFTSQTTLPQPLSLGAAAISGNKIFFAGGFTQPGNVYSNKLYVATIDNNGNLSSWTESGNLPSALIGHGLVEKNGMLYLIGGYTGSTYSKKVYKATPDSNGIISAWQVLEDLPTAVYRGGYGVKDSYIFTVTGGDVNGQLNKAYYSSFNPDGTLNPWETSSFTVPEKMTGSSLVVVSDYVYLIGGFSDDSGYLNTVYFSKLATSNEIDLSVPLLKQTDTAWKNLQYDTASLWSPTNTSIGSWGCAITSAAMVFQYHGINKLPDNQSLNPDTINSWLNAQPDGYIENGWVNWIALSRLSKLAKQSGNNSSFNFDALEYTRSEFDTTELKNILTLHLPGILEVPGHFIVAKGTSENTFLINDPYYSREKLTDGYNNAFTSLGTFTPSNTDLSYILSTSSNLSSITLKTSSNSALLTSFIQQPITSATPSAKPAGKAFTMLTSPKPQTGNYILEVTGTPQTLYTLQLYLYDTQGDVQKVQLNGFISLSTPNTISFSYNKIGSSSAVIKRTITFKSTLEDIRIGTNLKLISKELSPYLKQLITTAETLSKKNVTKTQAKQVLKTFEDTINKWRGTPALSETAAKILLEDVLFIKTSF